MDTFSKKDLSILFELDKNARSPLNRIAKKLKTSQQGLAYKIKKFEEHKTIINYHVFIDYACFGYSGYKVIFSLHSLKKEQIESFLKNIESHSSVLSIFELGGQWDYMVLFAHKNASRCNKELHTLLSQFPKLIKNYFVLTNIASYEMGRKYLSEQVSYSHLFIIGGDKEQAKIDFIEQKLLKEMYENPRIPYVKLAAKYHLNPKTVISKIKKLQTQGVIKGYGANIDCSGYGYLAQKIFFTFSSLSLEKGDELMKFFRQQEHVIRVSKTFGKWDYEIDVEIKDLKEFQKFCYQLRSQFSEFIQNLEICPVFKYHKQNSLPYTFFSEIL
ncbi:MAG TPA: Lrp/AsnC family transcriptional regulator [Nanoarchaeota archaeon]|nr:Lrp/AsnC family transcriptional regulator [Nanoarchaeota archaeon]